MELFYHTTKEFFKKKKKEREEKEKAEEGEELEGKTNKTFIGYMFSWSFFFQIFVVVALLVAFYFLNKHTGIFGNLFQKHIKEK